MLLKFEMFISQFYFFSQLPQEYYLLFVQFEYIRKMLTSSQSLRLENNIMAMLQQQNDSLKQQLSFAYKQIRELKEQISNLQQQLKQYKHPSKPLQTAKQSHQAKMNEMENYEEIFTNSQEDDCMSSSISSQLQQQSFKISTPVSIKKIHSNRNVKQNKNTEKILSSTTSLNYPFTQKPPTMNQQSIRKKELHNTSRRKKIVPKDLELSSISSNNSGFFNDNAHFPIQTQETIPTITHNYNFNSMTPQPNTKTKKGLERAISQIPIQESVALFENSLHISENSSSKKQSRVFQMTNELSKTYKKSTNQKKLFQTFFITGYNISYENLVPEILYYYPKMSTHFHVILDLIFGDVSQKTCELHSQYSFPLQFKFKDAFILPLKKQGSQGRQMQFLFAFETQELLYDGKENHGFIIPRMYCFITQWKFFNEFKSLTYQLVKTIEHKRNSVGKNLTQLQLKSLLKKQLESPLERLACKIVEKNQSIRISQIQNMRIQIDIPSEQQSFRMIAQYRHWRILQKQVRIRNDHIGKFCETSLLAALSIYILIEHKIILYSATKSKISEALFHCLQVIKPLEYVNPIILGSYRDSFQQYIEAPIPLILGVWHEQKKSKQKLQIFVTKKLNMIALIENGKLNVQDGIVFNLDTGLIFGGAVNEQLNNLIRQFHLLLSFANGNRNNQFQHFKIFNKMINSKSGSGNELYKFWIKLQQKIKHTQLYCYFKQQILESSN